MNFYAFADELASIKTSAMRHVLGGAALGALGAGLSNNGQHTGKAMLAGAAIGAGVSRKGYRWRRPVALAATGAAATALAEGSGNQMSYDTAVGDLYARHLTTQRPMSSGIWR